MMNCVQAVLSVMLWLTPWYQDKGESVEQQIALKGPVAMAICMASDDPKEWAFLITQGQFECRFSRYVLEFRCKDGPTKRTRCDNGRATGPWQVHRYAATERAWNSALSPVERYLSGAQWALLTGWRHEAWKGWAFAFQGQKHAGPPEPWAEQRVVVMKTVLAKLRKAME